MKTLIRETRFNDSCSLDVMNYVESYELIAPNFQYLELHDPTTFEMIIDIRLINIIQALRNKLDCYVLVESCYRGEKYNRDVGGSPDSQHLLGKACDLKCKRYDGTYISPIHVAYALEEILAGFGIQGGLGTYMKGYIPNSTGFNHVDTRAERARWVVYEKGTEIGIKDLAEIKID